jgi:hypothetical protein
MKSEGKLLPIEVDWRFDILKRMGRVRLKELMDFHKQAEDTFQSAMNNWEKEVKEFEAKYGDADGDHLIEQREEIESLLDRGHTFGIVSLYTFLEGSSIWSSSIFGQEAPQSRPPKRASTSTKCAIT